MAILILCRGISSFLQISTTSQLLFKTNGDSVLAMDNNTNFIHSMHVYIDLAVLSAL